MNFDLGTSASSPSELSGDLLFQRVLSDASPGTLGSRQSCSNQSLTQPGRTSQTSSTAQDERCRKIEKRGRKGHKKSRTGCFSCKRARIKCKENRPACDYCAHRGLECEWPEILINQTGSTGTLVRRPNPTASVSVNPQTPQPVYSAQDFRFFHHFIDSAYPHNPVGNDSVWKHEIPAIASKYDFLLNAMLALSASDIYSLQKPREMDIHLTALAYRVKSIESLNKAVCTGIESFEKGNSILATCYTLLFQSVLIDEALGDYFTFLRGCVSVMQQMGMKKMKFVFTKFLGDDQLGMVKDALPAIPLINPEVVAKANRSLEKMSPLCKTKVEIVVYSLLLNVSRSLVTSSRAAYLELRKIYGLFSYSMQPDESREFTDPANEVCQLLQAHFVAIQLITTPITKSEWEHRKSATANGGDGTTGRWLKTLHSTIPAHLAEYYEWTLWVDDEVQKGKLYNGMYD